MPNAKSYPRPLWMDRFHQPSPEQLGDELSASARSAYLAARGNFLNREGISEHPVWHGDGWHWTLEYRTTLAAEPLALIIPSPDDLQLAMPLDRQFLESLSTRRLKRAIRDGLELAQEPFHTRWGVWSITGSGMLNDLLHLVDQKLKFLSKSPV